MAARAELTKLAKQCDEWAGDADAFGTIVHDGLKHLGRKQREFADAFEVAISTVSRWADGSVLPHPVMQRFVVAWIKDAVNASNSSNDSNFS